MPGLDDASRLALAALAPQIIDDHRAYLRATVVDAGTCTTCRRDVRAPGLCATCHSHHAAFPDELADRVGFMTYAVAAAASRRDRLSQLAQSGWLMRGYKEPWATETDRAVVQMLCLVGLSFHMPCLTAIAGASPLWATVPSRRDDRTSSPLRDIAVGLSRAPDREIRLAPTAASRDRHVNPAHFRALDDVPAGSHVLLLEDTWVSGAAAQSAALTLRRAGAGSVSVLVLARWLKPDGPAARAFIESLVDEDYQLTFCPWTGRSCPHAAGPAAAPPLG